MQRRQFIQGAIGVAALPHALAQGAYPIRPITLIVPFAAGGGGDMVARLIARELGDRTKTPIVVDNKVGAGGNIGSAFALKSKADGYTLLNMSSTYAIQAAVAKLPFDPLADMQPIAMLARDPGLLIVNANSSLRGIGDVVTQAKAKPSKLTYGSAGAGSSAHVGLEDLALQLGVQLVHVPYKGTSQAFNDLLAGTIDMMFTSMPHGVPLIRSGRIRSLGVAAAQRSLVLPELPTIAEQGPGGYTQYDWKAIAAPRGTPAEVVAYLNREINAVLRQKHVAEKFESEGSAVVGGSPDQMLQVVRGDIERWQAVARRANLRLE